MAVIIMTLLIFGLDYVFAKGVLNSSAEPMTADVSDHSEGPAT